MRVLLLVIVAVLAFTTGRADAYPQFQLSQDQTCSGCHISPTGGGLLTENGMTTIEVMSKFGTDPAFLNGLVDPPDWLLLGGDIRAMGGWLHAPQDYLWAFPMQGELYAAAQKNNFTLYVNAGIRPAQEGNETWTRVWSREHYLMWQQEAGSPFGAFVRAGMFMPVFGLRLVEHPLYVRRYGGTELFSETYAASASIIKPKFEAHVTGWVENPLIDPVRQNNGGAAYAEVRLDEKTQVGVGGMLDDGFEYTLRGVLTAKHYLPGPELLLQGELQVANPHVTGFGHTEIASYLAATLFGPGGIMIDAAWGHYDKNIRIGDLDRDAFDLNIHWFATSHIELLLVNRIEFIQWGGGGPTGAWVMGQVHYRL
jgi:hypothetical protein